MMWTVLLQKTDVTNELVEELQVKTREYLQPNPNARAKMAAVKGISKLSGQAKANTYPQPEGVLGDCMSTFGKKLGEDSHFGMPPAFECQPCILSLFFGRVCSPGVGRVWRVTQTDGRHQVLTRR
jgi:BAR domain